jgi:peptidoglycan/LPS O-acetylase OafA/YrhL
MPMKSIKDRLEETQGKPSGFDYLRLVLALSVICFHTILTSYGYDAQQAVLLSHWRPLTAGILPMFFALSGFLVAGSLERSKTLVTFVGLRVIRIVPALAGDVIISALILGPLLTTVPLGSYFTSSDFSAYFLNLVGDIHYTLPGLFADNPCRNMVNGQLWTLPFELECYGLLVVIAMLGIVKNRKWLLYFVIAAYVGQVGKMFIEIYSPSGEIVTGRLHGRELVMIFIAGLFLYRFRDKIPLNRPLFISALVASYLLLGIPFHGDRFLALPVAYVTVYLGLLNPPRNRVLLSGDYSYGLFLYGFPIQQAIASLQGSVQHWYWNLLLSLPCIIVCAVGSWWIIEKPALGIRKYLKKYDAWHEEQYAIKLA